MDKIMNFDEVKLPVNKTPKFVGKKFYDKYFCKLVLRIDESKLKKTKFEGASGNAWGSYSSSWSRYRSYDNRSALLGSLVKDVKKILTNSDHRLRAEGKHISIFTNDVTDLNALMDKLSPHFDQIEMPINSNHSTVLDRHRAVVVRTSLFDKKYKFKIYMKPYFELRENRYNDVKLFLENIADHGLNGTLYSFFNTNRRTRSLGWTAAVYLNDPSDLMMFQLRFNNDIQKIEEAVLISSL
jgi:hypothetical protein